MTREGFIRAMLAEQGVLRRYARKLCRHNSGLAQDLVQDTFLRALEKRHLYSETGQLRQWLLNIEHNLFINEMRKLGRQHAADTVPFDDMLHAETSEHRAGAVELGLPHSAPEQEERFKLRDLHRSLKRLPRDMREVLLLIGVQRMRYEDAAAFLDIPVGTVRSRLSRGRALLRELYETGEFPRDRRQTNAA